MATPELDEYSFKGENIEVSIIYRYENDIERLYYKTLTESIDKYTYKFKQEGKLDRGKIYFQIMTAAWMDKSAGVEMYRYRNGYFCSLNGLVQPVTQEYLIKIINYFASDGWESFCYDETTVSPSKALDIFNRRLSKTPEFPESIMKERKLLELNNISLYFQNDSLICKKGDSILGQIKHLLPFSAKTKDFVIIGEMIYVVENGAIINSIKLATSDFDGERIYESPWVEIFPKWINFKNREGYFLSYSIDNNSFHKLIGRSSN